MRKSIIVLLSLGLTALPSFAFAANANGPADPCATGTSGPASEKCWNWTTDREHAFYQRFSRDSDRMQGSGELTIAVGGTVPEGVQMYESPTDFDYAPAHRYRYVWANRRVYAVDPDNRRVMRVMEQ